MFHPKTCVSSIKHCGPLPQRDGNPPPVFTAGALDLSSKPKKQSNVFLDNRGYPVQSHKFDVILHNVKGGPILCRHKHPAPAN